MDKIYFLNIIILMAMAIAIAFLPIPEKYLEEDKIHKNDPSFKIFHLNDLWKRFEPLLFFGILCIAIVENFVLSEAPFFLNILLTITFIIALFILRIVSLWYRGTYLISDGKVIKYVKRRKVQFLFNYEDIAKVRKREVNTGRSTSYMYSVRLKDGQIHKIENIFPEILKENFHEWRARSKRNYWIGMAFLPIVVAVLAIAETAGWAEYVVFALVGFTVWILPICAIVYYRWESRRIDKALNAFNQHRDSGLKIVH